MKSFKILLIEDNPFFKGLWSGIIARATSSPFQLDWANNDFIASEMLAKNTYDLIISDIILSGRKTGIDLLQEADIKGSFFIFASSIPEDAYFEFTSIKKRKADCFVHKPLNPTYCTELLSAIFRHDLRENAM